MTLPPAADTAFDSTRRFVRVTGERPDGFVEFDFAIGDPEVFVELVLPAAALKEFCGSNQVTMLEGGRPEPEGDGWSWRMSDAQQRN